MKQILTQAKKALSNRIAEKYGLKMPKTTAGLANEFDRVLTLFRNRK